MSKKRKAFTLTELLVVVVIIGVLAAVILPKFTKMIEARKTTEAVEMMTAVRNEQEARCSLGKNYTDNQNKLGSYKDGKNFDYTLQDVGMLAEAKSGKYSLKIPSYADGRICCSGSGCADLGKSYPSCDDLTNTSKTQDYVEPNADCGVAGDLICPQDYTETCLEAGYSNKYQGGVRHTFDMNCEEHIVDTCRETICPPDFEQTCADAGFPGMEGIVSHTYDENCEEHVVNTCKPKEPRLNLEPEPTLKTYLSYVNGCVNIQTGNKNGAVSYKTGCDGSRGNPHLLPCAFDNELESLTGGSEGPIRDILGSNNVEFISRLSDLCPQGPGAECNCTPGKHYISEHMSNVYCGSVREDVGFGSGIENESTCYSIEVFTCLQSETPPPNSNVDCSHAGNATSLVLTPPETIRPGELYLP